MKFKPQVERSHYVQRVHDGVTEWNLHTNFTPETLETLRLFIDPRDNLARVHAHIRRSTQGVNNFEVVVRLKVQYDVRGHTREMFISRTMPIVKSKTPSRREALSEFLTNIATLATMHVPADCKITVHTG